MVAICIDLRLSILWLGILNLRFLGHIPRSPYKMMNQDAQN